MPRGGPSPRRIDDLVAFLETLSSARPETRASHGKMLLIVEENAR